MNGEFNGFWWRWFGFSGLVFSTYLYVILHILSITGDRHMYAKEDGHVCTLPTEFNLRKCVFYFVRYLQNTFFF